jgi:tartrate dehydratase beta subunit/fumarate hydratase class I family protein
LLASHLQKPHVTSLNEFIWSDAISLLSASDPALQLVWQEACEALISRQIKEIELIDFPEGQERTRIITIEQLPKKGFALWKKPVVSSLQDMLRS